MLKKFGLKTHELLVIWKTILRPLTEYAVPLWHPGLTIRRLRETQIHAKVGDRNYIGSKIH